MLRRILFGLLIVIVLAVAAGALFVASRQHMTFDTPLVDVSASTDPAVIERGRYVVRNVVNCASCHGDTTQMRAMAQGEDIPLIGGYTWNIPPGKIRARNITPDTQTGIGRYSDGAIARALRFGVGPDGRALLPFMELQGLSDEDLVAVVSYLRTQPPVPHDVPMHEYTVLGKIIKATILANPVGPKETPPRATPHGATLENGRYLVESVALCWACHTQRNPATGELVGAKFAGADNFIEPSDPGHIWSPPNITSDAKTGRLGVFNEDDFVTRFKAGRLIPGSPMPWQGFMKMNEDDIRAIYRYLKTIPPVMRDVGPPVRNAK